MLYKWLIFILTLFAGWCPCRALAQAEAWAGKASSGGSFCAPGIQNKSRGRGLEISYDYLRGAPIFGPNGAYPGIIPQELNHIQRLNVKLKLPLVNKPGLKMLVGYDYQPETYAFGESQILEKASSPFNSIDSRTLKSNGVGFYLLKSLDHQSYFGVRLKMRLNGDYAGWIDFNQRYAAYSATLLYGVKKHDDLEWGLGIGLSHNFRRTLALPFLMYNRNFNDKWGLEATFPANVQGRYNLKKGTILLFGYSFQSNNYSVDMPRFDTGATTVFHLNHSEIKMGISVERKLMPWVWINGKAGYQFNFATRLESKLNGAPSVDIRPGNAPYMNLGFFLSPPRSQHR